MKQTFQNNGNSVQLHATQKRTTKTKKVKQRQRKKEEREERESCGTHYTQSNS